MVEQGRKFKSSRYFKLSYRLAPPTLQKSIQIFWMDSGSRKILSGRIGTSFTIREGRIYPHTVTGYDGEIFFIPQQQKFRSLLGSGLPINFELGFSPRGPIAFELKPQNFKVKDK